MARDCSKYVFSKKNYGKGQAVKAIVEDFINTHTNLSFSDLIKAFPEEIQQTTNTNFLFDVVRETKYIFEEDSKRYFPDVIELSDGKQIRICNQWDKDNFKSFIENAKSLGYFIGTVMGE